MTRLTATLRHLAGRALGAIVGVDPNPEPSRLDQLDRPRGAVTMRGPKPIGLEWGSEPHDEKDCTYCQMRAARGDGAR